jgi:3D (Asp-Asp-Asp) domain-containing protein
LVDLFRTYSGQTGELIVNTFIGLLVAVATVPPILFAGMGGGSLLIHWNPPSTNSLVVDDIKDDREKAEEAAGVYLPESPLREPKKTIPGVVTFYCSDPRYTDDTPFITANGTRVRFGIAASNIVDFNTRIQIPDVFGDASFVVMDRMNDRYNRKPFFDIWVETCDEARERGVHYTAVRVY